jgi:pimeloyl-ACP methyl ester carboxylesterase
LQQQGHEVVFCELEAKRFDSLDACAENLFTKLQVHLQIVPRPLIVAHSMGGMLILNILMKAGFYAELDRSTFETIKNSPKIFIQVPLRVRKLALLVLDSIGHAMQPVFYLWHKFFFAAFDNFLRALDESYLRFSMDKGLVSGLIKKTALPYLYKLILNNIVILNSFLGTEPQEFLHLDNYYRRWNLTLQELQSACFTVGDPDIFCKDGITRDFAGRFGAAILELPWGMHNPMYFPWTQKKFHTSLLEAANTLM